MSKPYGMIPAIPTPFNADGTVDYDGLKKNVEYLVQEGLHGILVGGTTGEYSLMSMEERKDSIKAVCEVVDGRVPVMVGTSCHRTEDTIELTKYASEMGASSALILIPYYMQTSEQGIYDYFKEIAESTEIGIVLYHYPDATNVEVTPEQIYDLSQIDGVVGIKNTTDQLHTAKVIGLTKDNENFAVLTGFEDLFLATLAMGGHGAIGLVNNLVPREMVRMYDLVVKENKIQEAIEINKSVLDVYNYLEAEPVPGILKAGLEMLGLSGGPVRKPLVPASDELKAKMKAKLSELGYSVNI